MERNVNDGISIAISYRWDERHILSNWKFNNTCAISHCYQNKHLLVVEKELSWLLTYIVKKKYLGIIVSFFLNI